MYAPSDCPPASSCLQASTAREDVTIAIDCVLHDMPRVALSCAHSLPVQGVTNPTPAWGASTCGWGRGAAATPELVPLQDVRR